MEDFGNAERERLLARHGTRFIAGQVIFREGDAAGEVYLLHDGRVRLSKRVRTMDRSLAVLRSGALFGEATMLGLGTGTLHGTTATALSDGAAVVWDVAALNAALKSDAVLAGHLLAALVRRVREAEDQVAITMLRDAQSRIVGALLNLAAQGPLGGRNAAELQVSPIELATRVGLDLESVRRGVQKLRDGDYLSVLDEKIEIRDLESLRKLFAVLAASDEIVGAPGHRSGRA